MKKTTEHDMSKPCSRYRIVGHNLDNGELYVSAHTRDEVQAHRLLGYERGFSTRSGYVADECRILRPGEILARAEEVGS